MANKVVLGAFVAFVVVGGVIGFGSITKNEIQKTITAEVDKSILEAKKENKDIEIKYKDVECVGFLGETCYINNIVVSNPNNVKEHFTIGKITIENTPDFKLASEMKAGTTANVGIKLSEIALSDSFYKAIKDKFGNAKALVESFELQTKNTMTYGDNKSITKSKTIVSMSAQPGSVTLSMDAEGLYPTNINKMEKELVISSISTDIKANDWLETLYTYAYLPQGEKSGWERANRKFDQEYTEKKSLNDFRTRFEKTTLPTINKRMDKEIERATSNLQKNILKVLKQIMNGEKNTISILLENKNNKKASELVGNVMGSMLLGDENQMFEYFELAFNVSVK